MYETLSADYDRFVNWENRLAYEMPFIEEQVNQLTVGKSRQLDILDSACGTGMHAIALALLGHRVSGADLFPQMVEKSRQNATKTGVAIRFETAGFGQMSAMFGGGKFDLVLCLGNSLPHLLSAAELTAALRDFAACLRPGGMVLIQNRNFDAVMQHRERWMEPQVYREGDNEWIFQRFYDFQDDGLIQFNIVTLKNDSGKGWRSSVASTRLRPQLHMEMEMALVEAGFERVYAYGSMADDKFLPGSSGNLVLTAVRK